ncbi:sigma-E factor negative regulatory protein [Wenzhouxiangella limi]|uniref:Sigma-E factor negative regulatory protein n=1 Tax=Wenzhouxiangella limi TaxID=2707351 RepID=A0A845UV96_9GAMM|nr:RseA family anti-sigma factor [Wenzhouxiangella limi]NDY94464.1 sigma-E factor negative regulatory protein [Wenzhouxiangella limi]
MTEANREQLSCLMDGELERRGRDFLVRRLAGDRELADRWQRYHVIKACLQREFAGETGLAGRVAAALDDEPALPERRDSALGRWLKPAGGMAIAASVAVAALVGINSSVLEQSQGERSADQPGFVSQATALDRPFNQPLVPVSLNETSAADRQRLNTYLLRHNQAAGSSGFVSYVPIVVGAGNLPSAPQAKPDSAPAGSRGR